MWSQGGWIHINHHTIILVVRVYTAVLGVHTEYSHGSHGSVTPSWQIEFSIQTCVSDIAHILM